MIEVSKDWTPEERLKVINRVAAGLYRAAVGGDVAREKVFRDSDRIMLLSYATSAALESNRAQILEGVE